MNRQPARPVKMSANLPHGAAAALTHPSSSKVYLVGVAHVSAKAAKDAEDCIMAVQPAFVVLELDQKRYDKLMRDMASNDPYGVEQVVHGGILKPLKLVFGGHLVEFGLNVAYAVSGALLGVPPGEEFRAAIRAAERVGAEIILADRDQETTLKRLSRAALLYNQRPDTLPVAAPPEQQGTPGTFPGQESAATATGPKARPKPDEVLGRMTERWKDMLESAGCNDPDRVLQSFQRILTEGSSKKGRVDPRDVAVVRDCGEKVVEAYRDKATKEEDTMLDAMEVEALKEVGRSTGLMGMGAAVTQVILRERDLILARRLWEAGEKAAGRDVVGVVGAGHIPGIVKHWHWAGSPQAAELVQELSTAPSGPSTTGSMITTGIIGAGFGYLAYKRPRLAAFAGGLVAFTTLPYAAAMVYTVNRWGTLLDKVVQAAQQVPPPFNSGDSVSW